MKIFAPFCFLRFLSGACLLAKGNATFVRVQASSYSDLIDSTMKGKVAGEHFLVTAQARADFRTGIRVEGIRH